jgi:centrosomal protein CEP41
MQLHNARYAKVPTKLNTGPNMRKVLAQYENTSGPNARPKQQNEFYTKLRPLTLAKLLEPAMTQEESVYKLGNEDACSMVSSIVPSDAGTDVLAKHAERGANLLLLDVRSFDRYQECHLFGARHYDPVQLTKATNNFPRELYYYRGPMGGDKMVVLYDHDGKGMQAIANTFVERGVENTFVLSGGLLAAAYRCPQLLVGQPPSEAEIIAGLQLKTQGHRGLAGATGLSSRPGTGQSARCSTAGSTCTRNTALSVAGSEAPAAKWR